MDRTHRNRAGAGGARRAATALLAVVAVLGGSSTAAAGQRFGPAGAAEIPHERLFDLGVADADGDGLLDLFTTNHKFRGALLSNDGSGNFVDVAGAARFGPTPDFPGYETLRPPIMDRQGVYVYATDSKREKLPGEVHLRAIDVAASGSISFGADSAVVRRSDGAQVKQTRTGSGQPIVYFQLQPGAVVDIQPSHIDLPSAVTFEKPPPPGLLPLQPPPAAPPVYVGTNGVPAPLEFVLNLRDRHGYAFADLAGDGGTDVFSVSGGLGGVIKLPGYVGRVQDELLVEEGGRFTDSTAGSGLTKGGCRGRQVAATDIDLDGQLDLFESCEGDPPNIYRQTSRGQFKSIEAPDSIATSYRFVSLDSGAQQSLLASERSGTRVYRYGKRGWRVRQTIRDNARDGEVAQFAVHDLDGDGDLDVLAVARSGNTLLTNEGGRLSRSPLEPIGIPTKSVAASFVDYDNDGVVDLDLIPQGLLRGVGKGRFRETGKLRTGTAGAGITNWIDYDTDGLRDPVIVTGNAEFAKRMKVLRAHNLGPGGHWLAIDLRGHGGNREAIGARVMVRSKSRRQFGWVGESEDSHHSQGHYRVYFGLGRSARVGELVVRWPDGNRTRLRNVEADRVLTIEQQ